MTEPAHAITDLQRLSDEAVMAIVCANDDLSAFRTLVHRWQGRIYGLCLRLTGNVEDAEDATQEVLARLFAKRDQYRGESRFSTWLWRIAINTGTDARRKQRKSLAPRESISHNGPVREAVSAEARDRVRDAVSQLPEELRCVVILRHYEQLKFREIAETLGLPAGTVSSRMAEALNRLSRLLRNDDEPDAS